MRIISANSWQCARRSTSRARPSSLLAAAGLSETDGSHAQTFLTTTSATLQRSQPTTAVETGTETPSRPVKRQAVPDEPSVACHTSRYSFAIVPWFIGQKIQRSLAHQA